MRSPMPKYYTTYKGRLNRMHKPPLKRILEFQKLLISFSQIDRRLERKHLDSMRSENDTEHSYNLAMTAWYLCYYFPELNKEKILTYALTHDLVEVHAGDTYVYADRAELKTKASRELAAKKQLKKDWPDFPDMNDTIEEYETRSNPEACFVYALDKIMPVMMIYLHEGYTWKKEGITLPQLHAIKSEKVKSSDIIEKYYFELYKLLDSNPNLFEQNA